MPETGFNAEVERSRVTAAQGLPTSCFDDFQRLSRTLVYGPAFQWLLVDAADETLRKKVMAALEKVLRVAGMRSNSLPLSAHISDVAELEQRLLKNASQAEVVHVIGRPGWFTEARWDAFNVRRERLAAESRARLVFWLDANAIALASRGAPDLWAWRGGVYSFTSHVDSISIKPSIGGMMFSDSENGKLPALPQLNGIDNRPREERLKRIAEIEKWLATQPPPPDEMLAAPIHELGNLLFSVRDFDAALTHWNHIAVPLYKRLVDVRLLASAKGNIADILRIRGQLDEALRIRQEEELPVYRQLGDVRSVAVTKGKIADIMEARGQLDEALRIRQEEEFPVFQQLGDVRELAISKGKIADILQSRGQLDEALRIRQEEELPVFQQLGDVRELAISKGKIAMIFKTRGQLDEAMRILQEDQLPVYQQLGDLLALAITKGRIADILQARGQLDEALRIRQEEELPIYEQLGDARELPRCKFKIAIGMARRGRREDFQQIERLLREAHALTLQMGLPEAGQIANMFAQIFGRTL